MSFLQKEAGRIVEQNSDPKPPATQFCQYLIGYVDGSMDLDCPAIEAFNAASRMELLMNQVLQHALHLDMYQAVYSDVPGTLGENPFDVLREAIDKAQATSTSEVQ